MAGDDGAEGAVFHDDHAVTEFGDEESGLSGIRMIRSGLTEVLWGGGHDLTVDDGGGVRQRLAGVDAGGGGCSSVWGLWIHALFSLM